MLHFCRSLLLFCAGTFFLPQYALAQPDAGSMPETLLVEFRRTDTESIRSYGLSKSKLPSLVCQSGERVSLVRGENTNYRVQAGYFPFLSYESGFRPTLAISAIPTAMQDRVRIELQIEETKSGKNISYSSTINGRLNEWLLVYADSSSAYEDGQKNKTYSTKSQQDELHIRVSVAGEQ